MNTPESTTPEPESTEATSSPAQPAEVAATDLERCVKLVLDAGIATGDASTIDELIRSLIFQHDKNVEIWKGFLALLDKIENDTLVPQIERICKGRFKILRDHGFNVQFESPDIAHKHIH